MKYNKFKLNRAGVRKLMKSEEMQDILNSYASDIQSRAGEGYETSPHVGKNRANNIIYPDSVKAKKNNLKNNTLLKAIRK